MYILPTHILQPDDVTPRIDRRTVSGGVALSGAEDVIATDGGGRVVVEYGQIPCDTAEGERRLNAWDAYLAGGVTTCLVPIVTMRTAPRAWAGNAPAPSVDFDGDDPLWPTAVGYRVRTIEAINVGAALLRATTVVIRMVKGSPILGGEWFGTGDRVHRIVRSTRIDNTDFTCVIDPPLRAALDDEAPLEFEWPVLKARLAPNTSLVPTMTFGLYGDVGATFVEAP